MPTSRKIFLKQISCLLAGSALPYQKLFAEINRSKLPTCTNTPFNCIDLRSPIYSYSVDTGPDGKGVSYANSSMPVYGDVKYKDDENYCTDCACEKPANNLCSSNPDHLVYDVYYPNYSGYADCPLPAIILFHAGGFMECSNFRDGGITKVCQELAKRGYVAFSVEYRGGRIKDIDATYTSVQQELAVYRASQDARGAIRSILKKAINNQTTPYKINTEKIFLGGMSAGGVVAASAAWYTTSMIYQVFATSTGSTIQQALGSIYPNFYYAGPSEYSDYQTRIAGLFNMWGAVGIPFTYWNNQVAFFNQTGDKAPVTPLIAFHGFLDPIFPYVEYGPGQRVFLSETTTPTNFKSETFCINTSHGPYTVGDGFANTPDMFNGSSLNMFHIARDPVFNQPAEHYVDCNMMHGLDSNGSGYQSDFGTIAAYGSSWANTSKTYEYMATRAAIFFQTILTSMTSSLNSMIYTECDNSSYLSTISGSCYLLNTRDMPCDSCQVR